MLTTVVVFVVLFLLAAWAVVLYNGLVRLKHGVSKAWSNIDVLLKQRHDELPKLVETCKQYMQHERTTLERVIAARSAVASAREQHDVGAPARPRAACGPASVSCSHWPRTTRISRPTTVSSTCSSASPVWRMPSLIAASCTTRRSTSTTCVSSSSPT